MVVVVILNWNGLDDTLRCLKSLKNAENATLKTGIVVIDNGSTIDPGPEIKRNFPNIDYVRLEENIGYAAGCNLGAREALSRGADFILFLNNDAVVGPNILPLLVKSFELDHKLGLVSPVICTTDQKVEFAGGYINYALGRFEPSRSISSRTDSLQQCQYASGCCLLVSRTTLSAVGMFDEAFFAYFEDADLCIRARKKGFDVACRLDISISHKGSAATRAGLSEGTTSPLKHYLVARNRILLIRKHAPFVSWLVFVAIVQPLTIGYYLVGFGVRGRAKKARAFLSGIRDGFTSSNEPPMIDRWL